MARYEYVLLDADHTLFDFDEAERQALQSVLAARGFSPTQALEARYLTINRGLWARFDRGEVDQKWLLVERFAILLRELGSEMDPAEMNRDYLQRLGGCGILLPGAAEFCTALAPHCTLAIVTNGASVAQRGRFGGSVIAPLFSGLFISEELGFQKPQREFFDVVCHEMGISDRSRVVMVGDNLRTDILGGINAGLDTIWYNPEHRNTDGEIRPTREADSYSAMERIILEG